MATFISSVTFTEQGLQDIQETCKRASAFKTAARKLGVKVREVYWTLGPLDGLIVMDAPDEETATALMLQLAKQGNVRTQTSRAYKAAEMQAVLAKVDG